ncbi:type II secretion system protein [candidate division KSB1 bacterium]|nr:type II secretion system protein [candidate division KSB1 bacterium]
MSKKQTRLGTRINLHAEQGFSLIEVLITTMVVGIVAVSVLSLFSTGIVRQRRLISESEALYFAQQGMEQIMADRILLGFDSLTDGRYPQTEQNGIERRVRIRSVTIDQKKVSVTVNWDELSDSLVCLIADY